MPLDESVQTLESLGGRYSRGLLTPEDAFTTRSPPRLRLESSPIANGATLGTSAARRRDQRRNRSRERRRKGTWKKLLWVKQSYPDNYTDEETFLDHLQRNPRLQPYEFWPLVADSTVIVQQVCAVVMFVCSFSAIYQERVSPITVVSWGSVGTVLGWVWWDTWVAQEQASTATIELKDELEDHGTDSVPSVSNAASKESLGLGLSNAGTSPRRAPAAGRSHSPSGASSSPSTTSLVANPKDQPGGPPTSYGYYYPPYGVPESRFSPRNQRRLATLKSAFLIYCALLGLSPILKSLTKSTAKDSIWAISFWLMCINVFFFDYGGGVGPTFPASLSTNAALMASTVLASRLPSTTHVFSLTLFSIEVFGLFPVFRRYLRHESWSGHVVLTVLLVVSAGGGAVVSISDGGWKPVVLGVVLGCLLTGLAMGICSWWLIGLQRYKNEIHGPWDPARPIIRRRWD